MSAAQAASLREAALAAEKAGQSGEAARLFDAALAAAPGDARLLNSAGGCALRCGDAQRAEALYRRAHDLAPGEVEFAINLAIVLTRLERAHEAVSLLRAREAEGGGQARYWSTRAASERDAGDLSAAAASYERCLALDPAHSRGLHGRARVALERGERDAPARYEAALRALPGDGSLWLGRAMALEAAGQYDEARRIAQALSVQMPAWLDAHRYLAELRLNAGEGEQPGARGAFADHYGPATHALPENVELVQAWCSALAGADCYEEAAQVAREALERRPGEASLALCAAIYASANGDLDDADTFFALLPEGARSPLEEGRHRLRRGDFQRAEALLEAALARDPGSVPAWALRSLAWRKLGDEREAWLHGQEGLVRRLPLSLSDARWGEIVATLDALHDESIHPVGQSVRGGSQTRGALFARTEPPLRDLHEAIMAVIEQYREGLPPRDGDHPLLRHREDALAITGSWSVRLGPGGRHTVHIHPRGVLSSALYVSLPPLAEDAPGAGCLELGGAPPEMGIDLAPSTVITPCERHLALFPSTLFHGTRPFASGQRMTVAFDVTAHTR